MTKRSDLSRLRLAASQGNKVDDSPAPVAADAASADHAAEPAPIPVPRIETRPEGVFFIGTKVDSQSGAVSELPPWWLCDWLEIIGRGIDEAGEHYRILRWKSRGVRRERFQALNLGLVGERDCWRILRAGGLAMESNRKALERLAGWLQVGGEDTMHAVIHRGGWNLGAYVLPSGEIIGQPTEPLFYNGDQSNATAYQARGSVESWRENVAALCNGNSRPMLAIGAALAAPLLHLVGLESGGFHLYGPSGCGKTTSANIGASVWGLPREQVQNWDATALALSNAAAARNDGLMLLDEIGQGAPEAVQMAAYRLFNGTGKMQGAREGGNREMLRWRILALSTGEVDLPSFINDGGRGRARAGQEVRLASLPADAGAGMGAFEGLHGQPDPNHLAKALDRAVNDHFGAIGRAFVEHVAKDMDGIAKRLRQAIADFLEELPDEAGGQVRRVAARFAVAGEALEIATDAGYTGWEPGDGRHGVHRCFDAWLDNYGLGNREDQQILEQAEAWFAADAFSRFIDWAEAGDNRVPSVKDCAGYRRREGDGYVWLVFPGAFTGEIAAGFDRTMAATVLRKAGMLGKGGRDSATTLHKTPDMPSSGRRFYAFTRTTRIEADT